MSSVGVGSGDGTSVDAADPARREDPDAGRVGGDHRRRDGRRRPATVDQRGREAGRAALTDRPGRRVASVSRSCRLETDQHPAGVDRDGRRDGALAADRCLGGPGDLEVLGIRQAVADERRLEGDDRPPRRASASSEASGAIVRMSGRTGEA